MTLWMTRWRWAGLQRNPLCRPCDRFEARLGALLVVASLLAAPLAAWFAGDAVYRASARVERAERAQRVLTDAVLLTDANPVAVGFAVVPQVPVAAEWTAADGTPRSGAIVLSTSAAAGTAIPIWTDLAGNLVTPPREHDQTVMRGIVAGCGAVCVVLVLLAVARAVLRRVLDRRRLADWDTEWSQVAPRWTGRC